jgi:large conductance mechanosensitive channel
MRSRLPKRAEVMWQKRAVHGAAAIRSRPTETSPAMRTQVVRPMQLAPNGVYLVPTMKIWKEFRDFAFKGNVIDLAIGVIIGTAFGKIVTAIVGDVIMPVVSLILPNGEWRTAAITLRELPPDGTQGDARLLLGDLASVVVDFLIVGFMLFLLVRAINSLEKLRPHEPTNRECPQCLEKVAYRAKRCKYCTQELPPLQAASAPPEQSPNAA